jgi:hypothetical protein
MSEGSARLAQTYLAFAEKEAKGRSPLYHEICRGVAGDAILLARLSALPREKRQPNLFLAAVKYLHGVARDWAHFRDMALTHWAQIAAVIARRRTQTNEPARCATLLPLLARLPQPLALLEVGASAGLCLLPDYYAYDYDGHGVSPSRPVDRAPLFRCAVNEATPLPQHNLDIVWRAGLDLNPLDPASADDARWLEALVWPGEGTRDRLLAEALALARRQPPRVVRGDLRTDLPSLAAEAPRDATLVVFHTAVLAYVHDPEDRLAFADSVRATGAQWISNESAALSGWRGETPAVWGDFLMTLNGRPMAHADSHGTRLHWLP